MIEGAFLGGKKVNSPTERNANIPRMVVRRLPKYLAHAQKMRQAGVQWISSSGLADALGLTSSTVRQDLTHIDFSGVSKRGYSTAGLEAAMARTLGVDQAIRLVVVGAGNLGRALALHGEFQAHGFEICGIFDISANVIGKRVGPLLVQSMAELPEVIRREKIDIGLVAVPSVVAQQVADQLVFSGIRGILNLTTANIVAPKSVAVVDARILASLRELAYAVRTIG